MSLTITPAATTAILAALSRRESGLGIRLCVSNGGCSGLSYWLEFADHVAENEMTFTFGEVRVVTEMLHAPYLNGLVIDYVKKDAEEGFQISSASQCTDCGCSDEKPAS